jgi:CheY-like chemotaxis protein/HPt (histidine-containing phosphotransfer) domain-containing protein
MDYESQILQEYFLEAREILTECEQAFLQLESRPQDHALIDTIFRLIHTLKGSAFAVGLDAFGRFAHRFENLLDLIRHEKIEVNPDIISLALQINDTQKNWLEALTQDQQHLIDVSHFTDQLDAWIKPFGSDQPKPVVPAFGFFEDETEDAKAKTSEHRFRILLVDDSKDQVELYQEMLEGWNCETFVAFHGAEALEILRRHAMDVILTDLEMPGMGGLELIQRIRAADISTPIVFVSGYAGRRDVIAMMNIGANGFLEKPVLPAALQAQIRAALKEKYLQDAVAQLTQLNFVAYLTSSQLARLQKDDPRRLELEARLNAVFEDIIHLQNELLHPKLVGQAL